MLILISVASACHTGLGRNSGFLAENPASSCAHYYWRRLNPAALAAAVPGSAVVVPGGAAFSAAPPCRGKGHSWSRAGLRAGRCLPPPGDGDRDRDGAERGCGGALGGRRGSGRRRAAGGRVPVSGWRAAARSRIAGGREALLGKALQPWEPALLATQGGCCLKCVCVSCHGAAPPSW